MAPSATSTSGATCSNAQKRSIPSRLFSLDHKPDLATFMSLTEQTTTTDIYRLAASIAAKIPIYDLASFDPEDSQVTDALQDEWYHVFLSGPGVLIMKNFEPDHSLIDDANQAFDAIIKDEAATSKGDHFAAAGSNSRIWNSFQKHAERAPESFIQYYANPWLSLVSESWLGPAYQVTAQVNNVHPGGKPQVAHRDYHLGFQTAEASAKFPKAMHMASSLLTLQGAVAHTDMPLESGPTRFLPFSQMFEEGFMAYRLPEFSEYFEKTCVSLPLKKGDAVFFNPALFHAAGENKSTDLERSANLLQISSAFGKTMESIDTQAIIERCWKYLIAMYKREGLRLRVRSAIKSIADGYAFPTNLDRRPPAPGGMAPESEQDMLIRALSDNWTVEDTLKAAKQIRLDSLAY